MNKFCQLFIVGSDLPIANVTTIIVRLEPFLKKFLKSTINALIWYIAERKKCEKIFLH